MLLDLRFKDLISFYLSTWNNFHDISCCKANNIKIIRKTMITQLALPNTISRIPCELSSLQIPIEFTSILYWILFLTDWIIFVRNNLRNWILTGAPVRPVFVHLANLGSYTRSAHIYLNNEWYKICSKMLWFFWVFYHFCNLMSPIHGLGPESPGWELIISDRVYHHLTSISYYSLLPGYLWNSFLC